MNKRILSLLAVVAVLMTMFAFTTSASAIYIRYSACGNGKPLNVRSGPGKNYEVIGSIPYGNEVPIDHDCGNGWYEIVWGSVPGFVMGSLTSRSYPGPYVAPEKKDPKEQETTSDPGYNDVFSKAKLVAPYAVTLKATKNSKGVANVRWAPSKAATLLKAYPDGTQVQVIAELDKWYQVSDPSSGAVGFVNTAYVTK
jgi:uncharacterized protein YgiM (DUF1202 family)